MGKTMASSDPLNQIKWLYHFTDSRNVPLIRKVGGLYSRARLQQMAEVDAFYPGGNEWSLEADEACGMNQYVHLCLKRNHPMEFLARREGRIQKTQWLWIDASALKLDGVLYSSGVSNKSGIDICTIEEARDKIDYIALYKYLDWKVDENHERRSAAEKCEILVPDYLPLKYFEKYLPNG
jgi:hypothetical protein